MTVSSNPQDELSTYFERSASAVRSYADRFEHDYARPGLEKSLLSFHEYPITSTFVAIFALLSFIPVLSFVGVTFFVATSLAFLSIVCGSFAILLVTLLLTSILLVTLTTLLILSVPLTIFTFSSYLTFRLLVLVRTQGLGVGSQRWMHEIADHFSHAKSAIRHTSANASAKIERQWRGRGGGTTVRSDSSESADGSIVVIKSSNRNAYEMDRLKTPTARTVEEFETENPDPSQNMTEDSFQSFSDETNSSISIGTTREFKKD